MCGNFPAVLTFTRLFLKLYRSGSFVTNCRFSPRIVYSIHAGLMGKKGFPDFVVFLQSLGEAAAWFELGIAVFVDPGLGFGL